VPTDHDNARELLERDVKNIVGYFRRKYPAETPESVDISAVAAALAADEFGSVREFAEA
jgi:RIO kinase 2